MNTANEIELLIEYLQQHQEVIHAVIAESSLFYNRYPIAKKSGKKRWIEAPLDPLKEIQNTLLHTLFYTFPVHDCAHGFIPQRSILTHAQKHVGQPFVFTLDLVDFFPSTHRTLIKSHLTPLLTPHLTSVQQDLVIDLCLLNKRLPQGAPTSPYLSNLVFKSFDINLEQWAQKYHLNYSRYADDLSFSGAHVPQNFYKSILSLVYPYRINPQKTRVYGRGTRQVVTGLVVNDRVNLPRPQRRVLRALAHKLKTQGLEAVLAHNIWTHDELSGHLAWLAQIDPQGYQKLFKSLTEST
jgi:RNA-directed DNA polymerase